MSDNSQSALARPRDGQIRPGAQWRPGTDGAGFSDIRYEVADVIATGADTGSSPVGTIAKITIDRPEVRNAFRPQTIIELARAFELAREDPEVGVIILTGEGAMAFCSGGDQRVRGDSDYLHDDALGQAGVGLSLIHISEPTRPY